MNILAEIAGAICGLVMRAVDCVTGRRKNWSDEIKDDDGRFN